jgi:hypothetical protein
MRDPDPNLERVIDRAKDLGTYGQAYRAKQYEGELDNLEGFQFRRKIQARYDQQMAAERERDERHDRFKLGTAVAILVTALISNSDKIVKLCAWVARLMQ